MKKTIVALLLMSGVAFSGTPPTICLDTSQISIDNPSAIENYLSWMVGVSEEGSDGSIGSTASFLTNLAGQTCFVPPHAHTSFSMTGVGLTANAGGSFIPAVVPGSCQFSLDDATNHLIQLSGTIDLPSDQGQTPSIENLACREVF